MTKRDRVMAALTRRPVDRPPVAFWQHVPDVDHTAQGLAEAMLAFHRRYDLDFIKNMPTGVYCVEDWGCRIAYAGALHGSKQCLEHAVKSAEDWQRIGPLDPEGGALGRELEAVRLIAKGRSDDAPLLHTLFSPLTIARKLSGDRFLQDLHQHPERVIPALEAITETVIRYAQASLEAGADGIFFAVQTASPEVLTEEDTARFEVPYTRRVLEAVKGKSAFTLLHVHGRDIYFARMASLSVHAVNWHDRITPPTLGEGLQGFSGAAAGGLNEWGTLRSGPPEAIAAEIADSMQQTGGRGLLITPGCVLPMDVPAEHLDVVVETVKRRQS
jgi:uroporphyrinogen decarboxylase